ncbi:MAG: PulJ/GspJ family protein [Planctomycetota bacterium]
MHPRRPTSGFTLVEVLIALAITAMLLTSVGVAVHAALTSHQESGELAAAAHATRVLCDRMARQVRTAAAIDPEAPSDVLRLVPSDDGVSQIEYAFDAERAALVYRVTTGEGTDEHVLIGGADGIEVGGFSVFTRSESDGGETCVRNVTVQLTFAVDNQAFTVTASAFSRRNDTY